MKSNFIHIVLPASIKINVNLNYNVNPFNFFLTIIDSIHYNHSYIVSLLNTSLSFWPLKADHPINCISNTQKRGHVGLWDIWNNIALAKKFARIFQFTKHESFASFHRCLLQIAHNCHLQWDPAITDSLIKVPHQ